MVKDSSREAYMGSKKKATSFAKKEADMRQKHKAAVAKHGKDSKQAASAWDKVLSAQRSAGRARKTQERRGEAYGWKAGKTSKATEKATKTLAKATRGFKVSKGRQATIDANKDSRRQTRAAIKKDPSWSKANKAYKNAKSSKGRAQASRRRNAAANRVKAKLAKGKG